MFLRMLATILLLAAPVVACAYESPQIPLFIEEMVLKHHFRRDQLERIFEAAQYRQSAIDAITAPATQKPWPEYRANFLNAARISAGLKFWKQNAAALRRAQKRYGVPQEVIVALLGVETFYGRRTGGYRTLDALSTLAFDYPARADFFRSELEQFLLLASEQQFNLLAVKGSYAGALGLAQFMPSSYRKYAVDFNGNGKIDLIKERADAVGSAANYLKRHGWVRNGPIAVRGKRAKHTSAVAAGARPRRLAAWVKAGISPIHRVHTGERARLVDFTVKDGKELWLVFHNFGVIKKYNSSNYYAMTVYQLAHALRAAHRH